MQHDDGFEKRTRVRAASDRLGRVGVGFGGLETDVYMGPYGVTVLGFIQ
jgi:hypothetical protein